MCLFQIANHPLLVRRIYSDEDVVRFAKKLHPMGAFGFECTLDRVIEELKSYNDFSIHRVILLDPVNVPFLFCYILKYLMDYLLYNCTFLLLNGCK